jgi:hypothetical protein
MAIHDELRKHYGAASAEQKLVVLRRELLRPILTVQSSAKLLEQAGAQIQNCLPESISPEEFTNTVKWLSDAAKDLQEILDALTLDRANVQEQHGSE